MVLSRIPAWIREGAYWPIRTQIGAMFGFERCLCAESFVRTFTSSLPLETLPAYKQGSVLSRFLLGSYLNVNPLKPPQLHPALSPCFCATTVQLRPSASLSHSHSQWLPKARASRSPKRKSLRKESPAEQRSLPGRRREASRTRSTFTRS